MTALKNKCKYGYSQPISRSQQCCLCKHWIIFWPPGCSVGGGGDQKIPAHQELPELPAHTGLCYLWGDLTPHASNTFVTVSPSVTEMTAFLICYRPLDRNHEERIWAVGGSAAHGPPEYEEVNSHHPAPARVHTWSSRTPYRSAGLCGHLNTYTATECHASCNLLCYNSVMCWKLACRSKQVMAVNTCQLRLKNSLNNLHASWFPTCIFGNFHPNCHFPGCMTDQDLNH